MKFAIISPFLLLGSLSLGQAPRSVTPPVLTDAQKLAYFKANSEYQAASAQAQQASQLVQQKQSALEVAVKTISEACGKDYQPTMDSSNNPVCVARPEAPKPTVPKK